MIGTSGLEVAGMSNKAAVEAALVERARETLKFRPSLTFEGPVRTLVPPEVAPDLLLVLPESALAWRDRRVADFQRSETHRIEVEYAGVQYALEKAPSAVETAWHVVEPRDVRADSFRVDELLFELQAVEAPFANVTRTPPS